MRSAASSRGEHGIAARFWGACGSRYSDAGYSRPDVDQMQLERLSADTRQALGHAAFERSEAAGRALDLDVAMRERALRLKFEHLSTTFREKGLVDATAALDGLAAPA